MFAQDVRRLAHAAGVTRLSDVTGFDTIGIPVWQAIRPGSLSLVVSQGKGRSHRSARISALMEALELHWAEQLRPTDRAVATAAQRRLWNRHLPAAAALGGAMVEWIWGWDLLSGQPCPLPFGLATADHGRPQPMKPISSGLAGQVSREKAVEVALCELRDRHGLHRFAALGPMERRAAEVAPESLHCRTIRWAAARIAACGAELRLWQLSADEPWPVFAATIFAAGGQHMVAPALGACCRADAPAAAFGAIAEAAQSRVTLLAGARDDIEPEDYHDAEAHMLRVVIGSLSMRPSTAPARACRTATAEAGRDELLRLLEAGGAAAVAVADISPADCPLPFVKAIAPGLPDGDRQP